MKILITRKRFSTIIIYVILMFFVLFIIVPLLVMWLMAIRPQNDLSLNPLSLPNRIAFENITQAWTIGRMNVYYINSIIVVIPRVAGVLFLACLAGYGFAKLKFFGNNLLFAYILSGMMMPLQALLIPLYYNLQKFHIMNTYWAMILPNFGICMPFAVFYMRAFFMDLPNELMDSASIDGCGQYRTFWSIMLPLAKPGIFSLLVFQFIWGWNDFLLPLLLITDDNLRPIPVALMHYSNKYSTNYSLVAAGVAIASVPIIIVYIFFQRRFIEGITAGSVKG